MACSAEMPAGRLQATTYLYPLPRPYALSKSLESYQEQSIKLYLYTTCYYFLIVENILCEKVSWVDPAT